MIGRRTLIVDRDLLLDLHSTTNRSVDAVEYDKQGVTTSLHDPAPMLGNGGVDQIGPQALQAGQGARIVHANQAAIPDHVGIEHGYQLAFTERSPGYT